MDEIENNKPTQDFDDGIDLVKWFFVLAQGKRIIIYLTTFFSLIGIIYSLSLPNIYESKALLAPVDDSSSLMSSALRDYSGLAGLAGINLPTSENSSNSQKAIEVMGSLSFFENHVMPKIFLPDLMAVQSWNDENNKIVYDESVFKKDSNSWEKSIPSAQESFAVFEGGHLSISKNKRTGYVALSIKHQSPLIAKQWVQIIFEEVNSFYRQKDKESSEKAVIYLNKQISNTSLSEIRQVTASLLEKEIQKLTLIEANNDFVFEYVYPPSVMEKKSEPRRSLIVIIFLILGTFLGIIFVISRHFFKDKNGLERLIS